MRALDARLHNPWSVRLALLVLAPTGFWAVYHFCMASKTIVADQIRAVGYVTAPASLTKPNGGSPTAA